VERRLTPLSQHDGLVVLLGLAALAYVFFTEAPARGRLVWSATAAAALLGLYMVAWPRLAPQAGPVPLAAAAVWALPLWAALLHDNTDDDEERGPWVLAVLPLLIFMVLIATGPPGPRGGAERAASTPILRPAGWVLAACALAAVLLWNHWRMRRSR
jgi:hypothetical protein